MTLAAGTKLGPYEIVAPLGAGGMGEVYRARDTRLGREVAIKVLPGSFSKDPDRLRRFEQEARAASQLNHPNIVTVHDFGTYEDAPYAVQELLEGETLRERLRTGALPASKAVEYGIRVRSRIAGRKFFRAARPCSSPTGAAGASMTQGLACSRSRRASAGSCSRGAPMPAMCPRVTWFMPAREDCSRCPLISNGSKSQASRYQFLKAS